MTLDEAVTKQKSFCLCHGSTQELQLKAKHDYYYQIQYCTNRKWCDFVVMTKTIHIQKIKINEEFWGTVLPKLKSFYFTAILPPLASPRPTIREPSEWSIQA